MIVCFINYILMDLSFFLNCIFKEVGLKWEQTHKKSFVNWGFLTDFDISWVLNCEKILILFESVELQKNVTKNLILKCIYMYSQHFIFCHWYSTGHGECLLDKPNGRIYDLSLQLPGLMYDVNKQCELMFGPGSQVCPYLVRKILSFLFENYHRHR